MMNRRELLLAGGLSVLAGRAASGGSAGAQSPQAARLLEALRGNRLPLTMGAAPAGRGWDWLVQQARDARFTLIGEEHGVAETARLATALFAAVGSSGYRRLAIEVSPIIARDIEAAARARGVQGVLDFFALPGTWSPFYLREEAELFATAVAAAPKGESVLWGLDREIFSDRYLIARLESKVPRSAREPFARMKETSARLWAGYLANPASGQLFTTSQDPALVSAVRAAWPNPDRESDIILRTLEESLAITTAARTQGAWAYSQRRTEWNRSNLVARLREERERGAAARVMMKFGHNHMIRGANYVNTFDLGAMVDEVAALDGERAFHLLVIPGPGSRQVTIGTGLRMVTIASEDSDEFGSGDQRLIRVLPNPAATGHEVIDLRALRPLAFRGLESWNPDLVRTIHGFDAAVIWKEAHAATPVP